MVAKGSKFPGGRVQQQAEAAEKRSRAVELRKAGATFEQIAEQVGYSDRANAHHAVMQAIRDLPRENAEEALAVELERCDALLVGLWPKARRGDEKAVHAALRVMERRAKLLGLDDFEARMADVAERRVTLEERQVELMQQVMDAVLAAMLAGALRAVADVDGATALLEREWPRVVAEVVPRELRALEQGGE
jgi:hypothetical protein